MQGTVAPLEDILREELGELAKSVADEAQIVTATAWNPSGKDAVETQLSLAEGKSLLEGAIAAGLPDRLPGCVEH